MNIEFEYKVSLKWDIEWLLHKKCFKWDQSTSALVTFSQLVSCMTRLTAERTRATMARPRAASSRGKLERDPVILSSVRLTGQLCCFNQQRISKTFSVGQLPRPACRSALEQFGRSVSHTFRLTGDSLHFRSAPALHRVEKILISFSPARRSSWSFSLMKHSVQPFWNLNIQKCMRASLSPRVSCSTFLWKETPILISILDFLLLILDSQIWL